MIKDVKIFCLMYILLNSDTCVSTNEKFLKEVFFFFFFEEKKFVSIMLDFIPYHFIVLFGGLYGDFKKKK